MPALTILPIDHPLLRRQARPVVRFGRSLRVLADGMFDVLRAADGVGLAAPQVGASLRLFVAEFHDQQLALCNPVVTARDGEQIGSEGCLSLPGFVAMRIRRAARIELEGQDLRGTPVSLSAEGVFARILQHEIDHLDGILFLDRLEDPSDLQALRSEPVEMTATGGSDS